jgi:hypothetical protein
MPDDRPHVGAGFRHDPARRDRDAQWGDAIFASRKSTRVALREELPVYIAYFIIGMVDGKLALDLGIHGRDGRQGDAAGAVGGCGG